MSRTALLDDGDASRQAVVRALRVAQETAALVPAYGRFLRGAGYDIGRLRSFGDFCQLPVMDKATYLTRYPLADRCRQGELTRAYTVVASSGTAGPATLWPRYPEQEAPTVAAVRAILQEHFRIRERWTLVVVAAAMGPWAFATGMILVTQRLFSEPGIRGTVVTPGLNQDEALRFVEQLGPHYDQTILVSYPALATALLEAGEQRGIDWAKLHAGVLTAGEAATESQRERIVQYLGKDPDRLEGFVNAFGASEAAGIIAYETRLCLLLRRLCTRTPALAEALFGAPVLPSVNQYNPLSYFLQVQDGELLLTMRGAVPLVRYNTHDRGGVLRFDEVTSTCRAHGYDLDAEWQARGAGPARWQPLPFMYVHGRSDAVILHGGNLYLDEVAHVLEQPALRASHTGNFELSQTADADGRVTLRVAVELREDVVASEELRTLYQRGMLEGLKGASARFRAAFEASQGRTSLVVTFVPCGAMQSRGPKRRRVVLPHEADPVRDEPPASGRDAQ